MHENKEKNIYLETLLEEYKIEEYKTSNYENL